VSIRIKVILVVLPLLIATLILSGVASSFSARNGLTRVAVEFLSFKAQSLNNYLASQWELLAEHGLEGQEEYLQAARGAASSYARSLLDRPTEWILALDAQGRLALSTADPAPDESEIAELRALLPRQPAGWVEFRSGKTARVGYAFSFRPFGWTCLISAERAAFFREVSEIAAQNAVILAAACVVSVVLLLVFSGYLTRPLIRMVGAMKQIIAKHDLTERVPVEFRDETGTLAHTFNLTVAELDKAYNQIKDFAFKAVVARKREQEIRNIFQKYVPKEVIDKYFQNPESLLVGEDRVLAVLFADIRGFTSIAERLKPEQMVVSLNDYFSRMVDIIMRHGGIVDKYIGDCIMAFFGAPVQHRDDALQATLSALEMQEALAAFNREQAETGAQEFRVGIGINYGLVTVGNIGSEKKMDYTVIGDMVNVASRLESLTKMYQQELVFSESVYQEVRDQLPCRQLDQVQVKGKSQGERIYTARRSLEKREKQAWTVHHEGLKLYYNRQFKEAAALFQRVQELAPGDVVSAMFFDRCQGYLRRPPPRKWTGLHVMTEK
jgi:class 3 adenylate cyclase/HAMP domain-containing protein